ncbi:MAG: hypothetical protein FWH02_06625 [Oscillospiraceae bacterium]|nr:hypothetical protein [Oscillospiraceae bacterium]
MNSIEQNITEYEQSADKLNSRIQELNRQIQKAGEYESAELNERRYALYKMMWEIQASVRELKEYIRSSGAGGEAIAAGAIPKHTAAGGRDVSVGGAAQLRCAGFRI